MIDDRICQVSTPSNTFFNPNNFVSWNSTAGSPPLNIKSELAQRINFYTYSGNGSLNNLRMTVFDTTVALYNRGFVGIGFNLNFPRLQLEVDHNIGVIPDAFDEGYYIDSIPVLRIWGWRTLLLVIQQD